MKTHRIDRPIDKEDCVTFPHVMFIEGFDGSYNGYSFLHVDAGMRARKDSGGPLVPGPWAQVYGRCTVIDNHGGSAAENARLSETGLIFEAEVGDLIDFVGRAVYRIERAPFDPHYPKLVLVKKHRASRRRVA